MIITLIHRPSLAWRIANKAVPPRRTCHCQDFMAFLTHIQDEAADQHLFCVNTFRHKEEQWFKNLELLAKIGNEEKEKTEV